MVTKTMDKVTNMQKGQQLQFDCQSCQHPISFSIFDVSKNPTPISCDNCNKRYIFEDEDLLRQLQKFEALCRQIHASEEILGNTAVGIDIGDQYHVKIPYRILLTRLSSCLDLEIGDTKTPISFRFEPLSDIPGVTS